MNGNDLIIKLKAMSAEDRLLEVRCLAPDNGSPGVENHWIAPVVNVEAEHSVHASFIIIRGRERRRR